MTSKISLPPELLEKAKATTSAAELLTLAQENGIPLTAEQAVEHYAKLHPESGAISDEQLDNVSGGGCSFRSGHAPYCFDCGKYFDDDHKNPDGSFYCKHCGLHKQET